MKWPKFKLNSNYIQKTILTNIYNQVKMAKKSKIDTQISHEEINDALTRFLKKGGEIQKVEYKDNGFLLKNDLALDDNYAEATDSVISQLNVDFEPENRI